MTFAVYPPAGVDGPAFRDSCVEWLVCPADKVTLVWFKTAVGALEIVVLTFSVRLIVPLNWLMLLRKIVEF